MNDNLLNTINDPFHRIHLMNVIHNVGKEEGQRVIDKEKQSNPSHPFITVLQELNDKKA
jgi:hypothetical protein